MLPLPAAVGCPYPEGTYLQGCPAAGGLVRIGPNGYAYLVEDPAEYAVLNPPASGRMTIRTGYDLLPSMGASLCQDLFSLCMGPLPGVCVDA